MAHLPFKFSLNIRTAKMGQDREWLTKCLDIRRPLDILEWRGVANSYVQAVLQNLGSGRYHPKQKASSLLKGDLSSAPPAMTAALQESLGAFNRSVCSLEEIMSSIGTTTMADARAVTQQLLDKAVASQSDVDRIARAVADFSVWKAGQSKDSKAKQRASKFKIGQFIKSLEKAGTPPSLAKLFANSGWLEAPEECDQDSWPDYVVTSMKSVSATTGEDMMKDKHAWVSEPVFFDLSGSVPPGASVSQCVIWIVWVICTATGQHQA